MVLGAFLYFFRGLKFEYAPICPNKGSKSADVFCKLCIVHHFKEILGVKTVRAVLEYWQGWQVLVETALPSQRHVRQL